MPSLEETLAPLDHRVGRHLQPIGDAQVLFAISRRQHDLRAQDNPVLGGSLTHHRLQRVTILVAQLDHERTVPRHRHSTQSDAPPLHSEPSAQPTVLHACSSAVDH